MKQTQHKEYSRKAALYQKLALPIAENIEIAENEPVFVANAQLEELDYRELYRAYSPKGRKSAAEPRIMFKLLVYGYMNGIYSTRKLEQACRKNIDFIWLLQGEHTTYSYYRCEGCAGCPVREQCTKSKDPDFCKEVKVCEEFAQCRAQTHQRLVTERGALLRMSRSIQVEGAFGVLKSNRKFKRFLMRGRTNISLELFLLCLAYNLKKYWSKLQHDRLKSHLFPLKKE